MRSVLLIVCIVVLSANVALAQGGFIGVRADPGGTDCNLQDVVPGILLNYYVVHLSCPGATASQWAAPMPACMVGAIWLSDTSVFPVTIGNSQIGVAIGYGVCLASPIHILTMNFLGFATTTPCCEYTPTADPGAPSGQIEVVDCAGNLVTAGASCAIVNPTSNCPCWATPVEETTWGKVKELYTK